MNLPREFRFSAGQLLAERFKIISFIARGGMGEVYEAEDLELRERVALKTVRPEIAQDPIALDRFRREIQLARRITHPNVCRLFDLFHHSLDDSSSSPASASKVMFLTMELLNGQTLTDRLQLSGSMTPEEALPIISQMAAGLDAAHQAGIIHRDFKSSNVILVPAGAGSRPRAVITDFGLAHRLPQGPDVTVSLAEGAGIFGTPAYMAPEQVQGRELTAAADIYSLGVVIYEMLTANRPFSADTPLQLAAKRLHENPVSPLVHRPDLDRRWAEVVLTCLEREPARRFAEAPAVVAALTGAGNPAQETRSSPSIEEATLKSRTLVLPMSPVRIAGILAILAVIAGLFSFLGMPKAASRRSVAVLGFRNLAGAADTEWLSTAFSEMLTTELAAGEKLRTISGENVARMKAGLAIREVNTSLARDTLSRIRDQLGSDVLIYGSYLVVEGKTGPRIRLDLRIQDAQSGEMLSEVTDEGQITELLDLVARTGANLRKELAVGALSGDDLDGLRATLPSTREAARAYTEGLTHLRLSDGLGARRYLQEAVAADPAFALSRSALATAWSMSGYAREAKIEAKRALDLSGRLLREERLLVQARYYEAEGQWDQAAESYRTLFGFFPDNLEYGLRLAGTRISAGKASEAFPILDAVRKLPAPDRNSARIDLTEARAAGALADYQRQRKAAANAIAKAEAQGATLLAAGARLLEGIALNNLGSLQDAAGAFETARVKYEQSGDRWGAANAVNNLAVTLAKGGNLGGAKSRHEETLALYREVGDRAGEAAALSSLANIERTFGNLAVARELHERALGIYREIGKQSEEARALNNLANVLAAAGQLSEAMTMYEAALPKFRELGDDHAVAAILSNLGGLRVGRGDLAGASELYEQSRELFERVGAQSSLAFVHYQLGDLLFAKGDANGSRLNHEKALAIRERLGEKGGLAESRLALAQLSLDERLPVPAEALARTAAEEFRKEGRADDEAMSRSVLARALLRQGRIAEAKQEIESMRQRRPESRTVRLSVKTTLASVQAALGDTRIAASTVRDVIAESRRNGLTGLEFEARLALGQVEIAGGRLEAGRTQLAALEKEAAAKGYVRIAQRAGEAGKQASPGVATLQR
jgi:eukaryotic-like serine/threonine-protein kinase